jgi:hypothetical protein
MSNRQTIPKVIERRRSLDSVMGETDGRGVEKVDERGEIMQLLNDMMRQFDELRADQVEMRAEMGHLAEENAALRRVGSAPEVDWSQGRYQSMAGGEVPEDGVLAVCVSGSQHFSIEGQTVVRAWLGGVQTNYNDVVVPVTKGQRWQGVEGRNSGLVFFPYRRPPQ